MIMAKGKDPAFWASVRENPAYDALIRELKQDYENYRMDTVPVLPYHARMRHYVDGDRGEFETPYFRRRLFLVTAALLALIYPEEPKYLWEVEELLWTTCDEYSWVFPAHTSGELWNDTTIIDLFATETGEALAEVCYLLEDRLDPRIPIRVKEHIRVRLLENFQARPSGWETATHNWAAVCAGHLGIALMYTFPEEFKALLPRFLSTMDYFLSGFPADGTCMEGFSYWHYGFGTFVWFADALYQFTDGKMDLLASEKVEQIAGYAQRSFLAGNSSISYADGTRVGRASVVHQSYLAKRYPASVGYLPREVTAYNKGNVRFLNYFRDFYYHDLIRYGELPRRDYLLEDAKQVILNRGDYSLAVKAGDNDEPHNHNDVGSFIFSTAEGQILCDLGCGTYTRQYFQAETRYGIFCNGSQSHNVPIINGQYQQEGKEFGGRIAYENDRVSLEFAGAYNIPGLEKLERVLKAEDRGFTLTDRFTGNLDSITERFVSLIEPEVGEKCLRIGKTTLTWEQGALEITKERHVTHGYQGEFEWVWCMDFKLDPGVREFTMKATVE